MVDVFATWYAYSGPQASLNPIWVAEWPAWFRDDIRFIMAELSYAKEIKDKQKKLKEQQKASAPDVKHKKGMKRR